MNFLLTFPNLFQSNFGAVIKKDSKTFFITGNEPRSTKDGPLTINMTMLYEIKNGFPEFSDIGVENQTFCVTRAKLVLYSGPVMNQPQNASMECVKYIEMFSFNRDWSAMLEIPAFESYSGTHVQLQFNRPLVSMKVWI